MCSLKVFAKKKGKKKLKKYEKLLEVSITINAGCFDILTKMLAIMEKFIKDICALGLCVLERGRSLLRLHLQMVCRIYISNIIILNKLIKKTLGWDDVTIVPLKHHVHFNLYLKGIGMHTYSSMIGYHLKTKGKNTFNFVIGMLFLNRCKKELMNMSSIDLVFVRIKFV
jgi:hypothetical protein